MKSTDIYRFYDKSYAATLIGKLVIVGYTHEKKDGTVIKQEQKYGNVVRVNKKEGVIIQLYNSDETISLPPDFSTWKRAEPGEYTLRSTGELVKDPDYLTNWIKDVE
ncbi:MAG TPA: hypothetical protein VM077_02030 [Candidatus Limnocylindrales bacterium]|nr:hypothetical protein [Candidatus Limnocylindrales bacterium]